MTESSATWKWALVELRDGTAIKAQVKWRSKRWAHAKLGEAAELVPITKLTVGDAAHPTDVELIALRHYAAKARVRPDQWNIITVLAPGASCDFADLTCGAEHPRSFGQAIRRSDGSWAQAPLTDAATLLLWAGNSRLSTVSKV